MTDKDFLTWILDRLEYIHEDHPLADHMLRLQAIIEAMPDGSGWTKEPPAPGAYWCRKDQFSEPFIVTIKRRDEALPGYWWHKIAPPPELPK